MDCPTCKHSLVVPATGGSAFDDLFEDFETTAPAREQRSESRPRPQPIEQSANASDSSVSGLDLLEPELDEVSDLEEPEAAVNSSDTVLQPSRPLPTNNQDSGEDDVLVDDSWVPSSPSGLTSNTDGKSIEELASEKLFEVDQQKALNIDGISDVSSPGTSFSIRCKVCDSCIFVTSHQSGMKIRCSDCHSEIEVPQIDSDANPADSQRPKSNAYEQPSIQVTDLEKSQIADEIKLAPLLPEDNVPIDPSFGLAAVDEDLLTPKPEPDTNDPLGDAGGQFMNNDFDDIDEIVDVIPDRKPVTGENRAKAVQRPKPSPGTAKKRKSSQNSGAKSPGKNRSVRSKAATDYRPPAKAGAARKPTSPGKIKQTQAKRLKSPEVDYPDFEFDSLFGAAMELVFSRAVLIRACVAATLLIAGNSVAHFGMQSLEAIENPTLRDAGFAGLMRMGVGWSLFAAGTLLLWYFCGLIFRQCADGKRKPADWKLGGASEWSSTLLLMTFSFLLASAPACFAGKTYFTAPLRMLIAVPLLVSVWFCHSPFAIFSMDAFRNFGRDNRQWQAVYLAVAAFAFMAFISGVLLAIGVPGIYFATSIVGGITLTLATMAYAAVVGWHSGKVAQKLN